MKKICTSLDQSKQLIEAGVDVDTADMMWIIDGINQPYVAVTDINENLHDTPAWSLTALFKLIPNIVLDNFQRNTNNEVIWTCSSFPDNFRRVEIDGSVEPIDACVETLLKLKKQGFNEKA